MKRTPIRRRSAKRAKVMVEQRLPLRCQLAVERGVMCEWPGCPRTWDDMHEAKSRARGGSITDPDNIVCLCRHHHDWVTREPELSRCATIVTGMCSIWGWDCKILKLTLHSWE